MNEVYLCPRCGSNEHEAVRGSHTRCAFCGLKTSHPVDDEHDERVGLALRAATFRAFERASFPPHALDARWTGPRRFASWNHTLDAGVTHLEVAHGVPPWQSPGPQVRVDTRRAAPDQLDFELDELVQDQSEALFRETGVLCDDLLDGEFSVDDPDLVVSWAHADIEIDDVPQSFRVLGHEDFWVGHTIHDDVLIAIEASAWPLEQTGLVVVRDFAPYDAGLRDAMRI